MYKGRSRTDPVITSSDEIGEAIPFEVVGIVLGTSTTVASLGGGSTSLSSCGRSVLEYGGSSAGCGRLQPFQIIKPSRQKMAAPAAMMKTIGKSSEPPVPSPSAGAIAAVTTKSSLGALPRETSSSRSKASYPAVLLASSSRRCRTQGSSTSSTRTVKSTCQMSLSRRGRLCERLAESRRVLALARASADAVKTDCGRPR